jgi:hypothetical protein
MVVMKNKYLPLKNGWGVVMKNQYTQSKTSKHAHFQWWWDDLGVQEVSVGTKNGN